MKVLLIDLGSSRKELNEPIGICAISAYAKQNFVGELHVDMDFFPLSEFPTPEKLSKYDIVGLSTKIGSLNDIFKIHQTINSILSEQRPYLVLGDLIATFATNEIIKLLPSVICVKGEGEVAFLKILEAVEISNSSSESLQSNLKRQPIPNVAFHDGQTIRQQKGQLVDLTSCPPPDRGFVKPIASRGGIIRMEASRGCAWGRCNFCAIQHKYCDQINWREIEVERIVAELEELSHLGISSPFFTDEDFLGDNPQRAIQLSSAIIKAKEQGHISQDMTLYVDMRVSSILAKSTPNRPSGLEAIRSLKEAGLREIFVGIESGGKDQVQRYKKASTPVRNDNVLEVLKREGLTVDVGFIMFDPEMQISELLANIAFLKSTGLNQHDARMTKCLRVEPGTPLVGDYKAKGLICGQLNIDELVYPYSWVHGDAEEVYEQFSHWEEPMMEAIYTIQAATRGEIDNEKLRAEWRCDLGAIRNIEISALEYIAAGIMTCEKTELSILNQLQDKRFEKVTALADRISG